MPDITTNYSFYKPLVNDVVDQDLWGGYLNANFDSLDSVLNTRTQNYNFADFQLIRPYTKDVAEVAYSVGNISGAVALDYENGNYQYATLTGNVSSLTVNNWPASGRLGFISIEFIQDGTGGRTIALTSAYKTPSAGGITLTTAASATDILELRTRDAGTTIRTNINKDYR